MNSGVEDFFVFHLSCVQSKGIGVRSTPLIVNEGSGSVLCLDSFCLYTLTVESSGPFPGSSAHGGKSLCLLTRI